MQTNVDVRMKMLTSCAPYRVAKKRLTLYHHHALFS